jgi:hypothetical protein
MTKTIFRFGRKTNQQVVNMESLEGSKSARTVIFYIIVQLTTWVFVQMIWPNIPSQISFPGRKGIPVGTWVGSEAFTPLRIESKVCRQE